MPKAVSEACYLQKSKDVDEGLLDQGTGLSGGPRIEQNTAYMSFEQSIGHLCARKLGSRCIPGM